MEPRTQRYALWVGSRQVGIQSLLDGTIEEKAGMEATLATTQSKMKRSTALITGLKGEKDRWISQVGPRRAARTSSREARHLDAEERCQ